MTNPVKNFIAHTYMILRAEEEYDMEIKQILSIKNKDGSKGFQAIAVSKTDPDIIRCIRENIQGRKSYQTIPEWDYNIDGYLLDDLEKGYEIEYMTLEEHYEIWHCIDSWRDEISHTEGLQKYLSYCQQNDITSQTISLYGLESVDITDLYKETNERYKIISETNIGHQSIVLAHNDRLSIPYVTWETTFNRKYGYSNGHYFSSYTEAFKDYRKRCEIILENHLEFERNKTKSLKEKNGHER